jgi:NifB/MoaA-like Fe-S oxidoreductase
VVTGSVAAPFVRQALEACGFTGNVVASTKEIACLITKRDLETLDCADLEDTVVIPGRAFVHDLDAARILSADGRTRTVVRGPERLTADGETSQGMNRIQVLELEMEGLAELIRTINRYGV